ncbi:MAG: hypothetical protein MI919_21495, partial [Holophagales bacterium]|nr:hypothetical protein [Holophagales bacterium]
CEGSVLQGKRISSSVIGIRTLVREGTEIERCVVMGTQVRQTTDSRDEVKMGIGRNCLIRGAIIDRGARIGDDCRLVNEDGKEEHDDPQGRFFVRGGVIVVPSMKTLSAGTDIAEEMRRAG